jgi:nitrite reductase/ring-hydroxylating ferredoxin subunit
VKRTTVMRLEPGTAVPANVGGTLYALDDKCLHAEGGRLSCRTVDETSVWCPLRGASFVLATGRTIEPPKDEAMRPPADQGVRTYRVRVRGSDIVCRTVAAWGAGYKKRRLVSNTR